MNILGMGPGELLLVMILALIVFGPGKLPEIGQGLGRAIREFRKATDQITEELTRELQMDTPAQEPRRPQGVAPQGPPRAEPAAAEAQNGPLVLEIKRPPANGAAAAQQEVLATVQATPVETPVAETPAAEAAPKPRRARRTRKPTAEPAAEEKAEAAETPAPARPRRRRKVVEAVEPAQD